VARELITRVVGEEGWWHGVNVATGAEGLFPSHVVRTDIRIKLVIRLPLQLLLLLLLLERERERERE
jgi:hypothetical protein